MNKHTSSVSLIDGHIEDKTDAEVKKALECCVKDDGTNCDCDNCKYCTDTYFCDRPLLWNDVADLINRQRAENERLQTRVGELIRQYNNDIEKVESRVIQDFAKKLKKRFKGFPMYNYSEINNEIDTLVHFYPCKKKITAIEHDSLCETETYKGGE